MNMKYITEHERDVAYACHAVMTVMLTRATFENSQAIEYTFDNFGYDCCIEAKETPFDVEMSNERFIEVIKYLEREGVISCEFKRHDNHEQGMFSLSIKVLLSDSFRERYEEIEKVARKESMYSHSRKRYFRYDFANKVLHRDGIDGVIVFQESSNRKGIQGGIMHEVMQHKVGEEVITSGLDFTWDKIKSNVHQINKKVKEVLLEENFIKINNAYHTLTRLSG